MTFRIIRHVAVCAMVLLLTVCSRSGVENVASAGNRLIHASSPYLREHADNPVDWYQWGPEALAKAKAEGKPLLVSVGYASCHWCHVMERESFMDTAVARAMNENFVSIKVDREERPDVDQIYINAAQLISGSAGWPLNAFALPDGKPFYAATYFPRDQWMKVLLQVSKAYKEDHENVVKQAEAITTGIQSFDAVAPAIVQSKLTKQEYQNIFSQWQSQFDSEQGGLVGTPKFPMPSVWEYLLQDHYLTGNIKSLDAVTITLDKMADGGIYDQIGGGFARYATDANWKVPHFEKMLYDNGQLVSLYSHAFQVTKNDKYAKVVQQTLEFVSRELTHPEAGFYSSINADSEDEEGKFYVWSKREIEDLLDVEMAKVFVAYYNVTDSGNWEPQKNILHRKIFNEEIEKRLAKANQILLEARSKRVRPSLDDKIMTSWNAIMLNGYLDAYAAINRKEYLEAALKNATFLEKKMIRANGRLWRTYKDNVPAIEAFLDDYALLSKAYIHLYEVTFDLHWLELSHTLLKYAIQHFHDNQGGMFYYTSNEAEPLIARKMELSDNVVPSSNSIMADVLFRLGTYYEDDSLLELSHRMLSQMKGDMIKNGPYYANWAGVMGKMAYQPYEVAIMGDDAVERSREFQNFYLPTAFFMGGSKENLPLLENKNVKGETIIYVCRNKVCKRPVKTVDQAILLMK